MDLANIESAYNPNDGFAVELSGPDEAPLINEDGSRMTITVLGADSDAAVKARNANVNRHLAKGARAKITAESNLADGASFLAKLTVGWNITMGGSKPTFGQDEAQKLYLNPRLAFIREQVDAAIAERTNFLKK
jgi:hypothetical protein